MDAANRRPVLPVAGLLAVGLFFIPFWQIYGAIGVGLAGVFFGFMRTVHGRLSKDERLIGWGDDAVRYRTARDMEHPVCCPVYVIPPDWAWQN